MIVTSGVLADTLVALLRAQASATGGLAGIQPADIYGIRAYAVQQGQPDQIRLELPSEHKQSISRQAGNQYIVVATLPLVITVQVPAAPGEAGAALARGRLSDITRAIETTVIGAPALERMIQRIVSVDTHPRVDGNTGAQIAGEAVWIIALEFYQGPEDFYVQQPVPLEEVAVSDPGGKGLLDFPDLNPS